METAQTLSQICEQTAQRRLPRWEELPDLELYMDQILSLTERYLGTSDGGRKGLTAAMVNNYVKLGVMPAPVKKKYTRLHLAYLLIICTLKPVLPIDEIGRMLGGSLTADDGAFYDAFCREFTVCGERAARNTQERLTSGAKGVSPISAACCAALRAQAERSLALALREAENSQNA